MVPAPAPEQQAQQQAEEQAQPTDQILPSTQVPTLQERFSTGREARCRVFLTGQIHYTLRSSVQRLTEFAEIVGYLI